MIELSGRFDQAGDVQYALLRFTGTLDVEGTRGMVAHIKKFVPLDYPGFLVIDFQDIRWDLNNDDIKEVTDIIVSARYYFRNKTAFLIPEDDVGMSNDYYNAAIEREGILFADFHALDDALRWLGDPGH